MTLTLYIGNKNYSSWSMRPWLAMKGTGIVFQEKSIPLYTGPEDKAKILEVTPSGKVPVLVDDDVTVWDSLAIIEYLAEKFPQAGLWPRDRAMRAHARAISAEMHSGFGPLRTECGMNIHRRIAAKTLSDDARDNIRRIEEIWTECRNRHGRGGPYLFGQFGAADAMFAPVVHRFRTYAIQVSPTVESYMAAMQAHPAFAEWAQAALDETLIIERFEQD
jgi:glutathione S-transferase